MTHHYIGKIEGVGWMIRHKRQRKTGGSKNVYTLGIDPLLFKNNQAFFNRLASSLNGEVYDQSSAYVFTKLRDAEKAWMQFVLKFS